MSDTQLHLAMAVPTFAVLVGILINLVQISGIRGEVSGLKTDINGLGTEMNGLRTEFKGEINSLRAGFDLLTGRVIELVDRISRLEAKIEK